MDFDNLFSWAQAREFSPIKSYIRDSRAHAMLNQLYKLHTPLPPTGEKINLITIEHKFRLPRLV